MSNDIFVAYPQSATILAAPRHRCFRYGKKVFATLSMSSADQRDSSCVFAKKIGDELSQRRARTQGDAFLRHLWGAVAQRVRRKSE